MEHTPFPLGLAPGKPIRDYLPVNDNPRPVRPLNRREGEWLRDYLAPERRRNELFRQLREQREREANQQAALVGIIGFGTLIGGLIFCAALALGGAA